MADDSKHGCRAAVSFCSATTLGVTLIPSVKVGATYELTGNLQSSTGLINDGAPHILRFDLFSTMSRLGPHQMFGGELFTIQFSDGLTRSNLAVSRQDWRRRNRTLLSIIRRW